MIFFSILVAATWTNHHISVFFQNNIRTIIKVKHWDCIQFCRCTAWLGYMIRKHKMNLKKKKKQAAHISNRKVLCQNPCKIYLSKLSAFLSFSYSYFHTMLTSKNALLISKVQWEPCNNRRWRDKLGEAAKRQICFSYDIWKELELDSGST